MQKPPQVLISEQNLKGDDQRQGKETNPVASREAVKLAGKEWSLKNKALPSMLSSSRTG